MTTVGSSQSTSSPASRSGEGSVVTKLLYHPRKLFLRRALFQVHLWTGVVLVVYLVAISLSGAILVFKTELISALIPSDLTRATARPVASVPEAVDAFRAAYPRARISNLIVPSVAVPVYQFQAVDARERSFAVLADASGEQIVQRGRSWVDWVYDLHYYLLLNPDYGMKVNGVGGGLLLASALSGLVVWWPGVKLWKRGFLISLRSRWRRMTYDAHSAIGIWTLLIVLWWAFSGLYFGWYRQIAAVVNVISPIRGMASPVLPAGVFTNDAKGRVSLETILASAQQASPQGHLYSITNATLALPTVSAAMDLRETGDFSHRDLVTVDAVTGRALSVWHYGKNETAGDWILWAMHPIHFGTLWGTPVKVIWFLLGVSLAVLSVTGLLMYWNRYLRHRLF